MWQNSAKNSELEWTLINEVFRAANIMTVLDALLIVIVLLRLSQGKPGDF